jgi:hypothetical protein
VTSKPRTVLTIRNTVLHFATSEAVASAEVMKPWTTSEICGWPSCSLRCDSDRGYQCFDGSTTGQSMAAAWSRKPA